MPWAYALPCQESFLQLFIILDAKHLLFFVQQVTASQGSRVGAVVRALASHQCGPGSIPVPDAISGLGVCWFSSLLRGFFSEFYGFLWAAVTTKNTRILIDSNKTELFYSLSTG